MFAGHLRRACLIGLLALAACATGKISADDQADALRQQALRTRDRLDVIEKLEQVEFERARLANTVLAYRRFLSEFPSCDEAATARDLLEELRFADLKQVGTELAWETYLEEYPRGKHVAEARTALGTIQITRALASNDIDLVHRTLGLFPDHPRHGELAGHEDALAWTNAQAKGDNVALEDYLALHPSGTHRVDALRAEEQNDERDMRESEDIVRAQARTERADAGPRQRALVVELELARALRTLDFDGVKEIARSHSDEAVVETVYNQARTWLKSLARHPFSKTEKQAIENARPGAGLPPHDQIANGLFNGDPVNRVASARELVEWARPEDVKTLLMALDSDYVGLQLEVVHGLRVLAQSLKPAVWKAIDRAREDETLSRDLTVNSWRQAAALREADGRSADAVNAWQEVVALDTTSLAARSRLFSLQQAAGDRLAFAAASRDLATTSVQFAENRAVPSEQTPADGPAGPGRIVGLPGSETVLRQLCTAIDLETDAAHALGTLASSSVGSEEQQLLTLAKTDAEDAISNFQRRRAELEEKLKREAPNFPPCGSDPSSEVLTASRRSRAAAIAELGQSGDTRLVPFVQGLVYSPSPEVKAAALAALQKLQASNTVAGAR